MTAVEMDTRHIAEAFRAKAKPQLPNLQEQEAFLKEIESLRKQGNSLTPDQMQKSRKLLSEAEKQITIAEFNLSVQAGLDSQTEKDIDQKIDELSQNLERVESIADRLRKMQAFTK